MIVSKCFCCISDVSVKMTLIVETFNLTFTVTDRCGATGTMTLKITVLPLVIYILYTCNENFNQLNIMFKKNKLFLIKT